MFDQRLSSYCSLLSVKSTFCIVLKVPTFLSQNSSIIYMNCNVDRSKPAIVDELRDLPSEVDDVESEFMSISSGQSEDEVSRISLTSQSNFGIIFVDALGRKSIFSWAFFTYTVGLHFSFHKSKQADC